LVPLDEANLFVQAPINPLEAVEKMVEEWKHPKNPEVPAPAAEAVTTIVGIELPRFDSPCPFPSLDDHNEYLAWKF
jgi:hypothetical protein